MLSFAVMLVSVCSFAIAYADDGYVVKSDDIIAQQGEAVTVPLNLSGNNGLMGFKLTVEYPDGQLRLTNVSSGSLTADGLFNTTVTSYEAVKGSFDILWSNNAEVKGDGTLAVLTFSIKPTADNGEYNISVTYSQEDTFNEAFEDVRLNCKPIKVTVSDEITSKVTEKATAAKTDNENENKVSGDYLIASVEQIVQSFGTNDINSLTEEQQKTAMEYVNNRVDSYGGGKQYSDFDDLKEDYAEAVKTETVRKLFESADTEAIITTADEVLAEYGAKSFSELPDDKKQEAVEKALKMLAESGADEEGFQHIDSYDVAAVALDEAVKSARGEENITLTTSESGNSSKKKIEAIAIIAVLTALIFILILSVVLIIRRRKRNEKAE